MGQSTRLVGGASIVLAPLAAGTSDQLRMAAEPPTSAGIANPAFGVESVLANLAAISGNQGLFTTAAVLAYLAALLTIPALLAIWRLSVDVSARWAWTGAVMSALGVVGQVVHLIGYYGLTLTALRQPDREAAAQLIVDAESTPFVIAVFVPFFFALLCAIPQAVGLRRASVIPLWASVAIVAATVTFLFVGSTPWSSAIWAILLVIGFIPAAAAMLRHIRAPELRRVDQIETATHR
jgi:hypothetical protein